MHIKFSARVIPVPSTLDTRATSSVTYTCARENLLDDEHTCAKWARSIPVSPGNVT
ncbi:hypothetical protein SCLCIDRAFT_1213151 [Scleroderma citrinum Foug A]|uniref:Uncharacterized protein n=1 Tax=Scleroderma citrinum Foug A TaxID=1036808 RepID=A0A0C3E9L3_9AGAM|nr:hypothetical protein SCLCIDRAFT_1213151 [Scleroderma citrinum Foug A]